MNIAILIDAENVLPGHADLIFAHGQELGTVTRKEIYGAASALTSWVAPVLKYAIHANLTIKAAKGKNSSDIALVIGAMDLLLEGGIDGVIIASSDSDFSSLSVRLRNAGIEVIGMGTEKANALWRTACSSFVVLQNQKPAQPAKQSQAAKQAQSAKQSLAAKQAQPAKQSQGAKQAQPAKQAQQSAKQEPSAPAVDPATSTTHKQRVAVIGEAILKRLRDSGGRVQVSTLFPALNKLPEYKVDRQGSGKRPLNYLTSTYGSVFRFEETPDGKNWVSLPDAQAAKSVEPEESASATDEVAAISESAAEKEPVFEPSPATAETEAARADSPAASAEVAAGTVEGEGYVTPQEITRRLIEGGFDEATASQVTDIFADSASYRAAYNRLRSVFGNNAGRDYYQRAKEILTAR